MFTSICTIAGSVTTCQYDGGFFYFFLFFLASLVFIKVVEFFMNFVKSLF